MAHLLLVNPRFERFVARHRLDDFHYVMRQLVGRRKRGHVDRDVHGLLLEDDAGPRRVFLKREYKTSVRGRFMNWVAGFGRATRSRREWHVLRAMLDAGLGCAEPIIYAERGTLRPVGYIFLCEVEHSVPLVEFLTQRESRLGVRQRRQLAAHLGREVARLHEAGFTHPDLYSKHIFLSRCHAVDSDAVAATVPLAPATDRAAAGVPDSADELPRVSFLDLQRGGIRWSVPASLRAVDLAALDATIARELISSGDRLTFLLSYLSHARPTIDLRTFLAAIRARRRRVADRPKIRDMREQLSVQA